MLFSRHTNGIRIKTARELDLMRTAGRIVAEVHAKMSEMVQPGVSTADLDAAAEAIIRGYDAIPAFVNYPNARQGGPVFPATLCTSINEELVHGIPSQQRVLAEGDIISIDVGVIYNGYVGDSGWTYPVGQVSAEAQRLLETTEGSLWAGIAQAKSNNRFVDVSRAVQEYVEERGFAVVREYTSHGVGSKMHEEPQILNFVPTDRRDAARSYPAMNRRLVSGMTFALEPMVNAGVWETRIHDDEWTVSTKDGSLSAHFEHTIAITNGEPEILTTL
ncbi:MAG: type I methionyl aminopeptidase [Caldilineae bacterium]|nr:type I methionyl aminopeptidase [Anaerolineae bacterium]MCB0203315.1 type I methionyl aminopeptidase [Anaerolineae bacterium]MCB0252846.1 type I methionyl aminopeptidase [Anaerolineae bacterium]MCB9153551.1 type I methionyl aminopeptidase [Caldilineae bacterium]